MSALHYDNLLQEAKAVDDLTDAVVSVLPWVNFDALLPPLKKIKTPIENIECTQTVWQKIPILTLSYLEMISLRSSDINVSMSFFMSKSKKEKKAD